MYRCLFTHVHTIEKVIYNNSEIEARYPEYIDRGSFLERIMDYYFL